MYYKKNYISSIHPLVNYIGMAMFVSSTIYKIKKKVKETFNNIRASLADGGTNKQNTEVVVKQ